VKMLGDKKNINFKKLKINTIENLQIGVTA
jgi:hypothetical protein